MVFTACDEDVIVGELPVFAGGVLELEGGAFEGVEAPEAGDGAGDGVCAWMQCWRRRCLCGMGFRGCGWFVFDV